MLVWLRELRETMFTSLLKDAIKDTEIKDADEQPDAQIHRATSWEGPEYRSFCPRGAGVN